MNTRANPSNLRKAPSQTRSQRMVERIIDAARHLLKASGRSEPLKISTNHIAKQAGISVGSLYQYFPNSEAILLEVHRQILEPVKDVLESYDSEAHLSLPREDFFRRLFTQATASEADNDTLYAIQGAMKLYPALIEMDNRHADMIASYMARFLRHYGSDWEDEKLKRLGLYSYYVDAGTWRYREAVRPSGEEARAWEVDLLMSLIEQCFRS